MGQSHKSICVCLVNPPVIAVLEPWYDTPTFGRTALAYLAGYLRQFEGFEIHIIDAKFERLSFQEVVNRLKILNPQVVGITAFTNEIKPAAYLAHQIHVNVEDCITVIGGPHVTAIPKETLSEFPSFDIGVVGEGEETFYQLCEAVRTKQILGKRAEINGLVFRQGANLIQTPARERILDQDSIPYPAWDLLPPAQTYFIQSIRGCPYNCLFCMNPNGRVARKRSVENVMGEIEWILEKFSPKRISFGDELFSVDMARTANLLDAMSSARIGQRVKWDVQTHVHYVNAALFRKFKQANVERVELGIETGDEESLKKMGKGTSLETILAACNAAHLEGVTIGTFFLLGQPNETILSLKKTVSLAVKINPDLPMFGLMTPYPGTEVSRMAAKGEGGYKLLTTDWDLYNKQIGGAMKFAGLTRRQIEWFQIKAYLKVYVYNRRWMDLLAFVWEYRVAAWEVLKKMVFGKLSVGTSSFKPMDYDALFNPSSSLPFSVMVEARSKWNATQQEELKRAKRISPELLDSIKGV